MNPGGLRADMAGTVRRVTYPRTLTYRQAANVQPFANTLVNMDLTGAQIKEVLEQQWQPVGATPARRSCGWASRRASPTPTTRRSATGARRITGMWLDGEPIDPPRRTR